MGSRVLLPHSGRGEPPFYGDHSLRPLRGTHNRCCRNPSTPAPPSRAIGARVQGFFLARVASDWRNRSVFRYIYPADAFTEAFASPAPYGTGTVLATQERMSIGPAPAISAARWAEEWERLSLTATSGAMGCYLHGCANFAMARTPQHALAELHKTQTELLRHSVDTIVEATNLWRKQNAELIVTPDGRTRSRTQATGRQVTNHQISVSVSSGRGPS